MRLVPARSLAHSTVSIVARAITEPKVENTAESRSRKIGISSALPMDFAFWTKYLYRFVSNATMQCIAVLNDYLIRSG